MLTDFMVQKIYSFSWRNDLGEGKAIIIKWFDRFWSFILWMPVDSSQSFSLERPIYVSDYCWLDILFKFERLAVLQMSR